MTTTARPQVPDIPSAESAGDPDTFHLFREDLTARNAFTAAADHFAFALGRHFRVGALPAGAEVETGPNMLLDAMPDARLPEGFTAPGRTSSPAARSRCPWSSPPRADPAPDAPAVRARRPHHGRRPYQRAVRARRPPLRPIG